MTILVQYHVILPTTTGFQELAESCQATVKPSIAKGTITQCLSQGTHIDINEHMGGSLAIHLRSIIMVHVCSRFSPKRHEYHASYSTSIIAGGQVLSSVKTSYIILTSYYSVILAYIWTRFPFLPGFFWEIIRYPSVVFTRNSPLKLRSSLVWIILTWFDSLMFMRTGASAPLVIWR